ncbi:MAG: DUF2177 family protein [Candidatus Saccharibacteria bacterium]|nr:DUF2177 family protein [Candidatus Saccharibacteria bacterium]
MEFIKQFLVSFGSLLLIDSVWLTKVAPKFYKSNIGHLMAENPSLMAAGLFYFIYIVGVVVFVVSPAVADKSLSFAATRGALFGLVAYSTFDLTSMAVFKNWPVKVTIVDMLWGTILTMGVAVLATFVVTRYLK